MAFEFQAFVMRKKSILELETEMLNGQKLQGPETAAEVEQTRPNNWFIMQTFVCR